MIPLGKWKVGVDGHELLVTVDRGDNDKDVVRVNGRVVAKPLDASEDTRSFSIGGWPYTLRRTSPNAYALDVDEINADAARARSLDTANYILAHSDAPLGLPRSRFFKRLPLFAWIAGIAAIAALLLSVVGFSYKRIAMHRVDVMLREIQSGNETELAVRYWARHKANMDAGEMWWAKDHFPLWRREKGIDRPFHKYDVIGATMVEGAKPETAIVRVVIDGTEHAIRVPKDLPMTWAD